MSEQPLFEQITIIGLGLIGSSLARAIHKHKLAHTVIGCDKNEVAITYAQSHRFIDRGVVSPFQAVKGSQLVILATPPSTLKSMAQEISPNLMKGAIIMDMASVKRTAMDDLASVLPTHTHFIPTHPIAGSEQSGSAAGRADLFERKRIVITPNEPLPTEMMKTINRFWQSMGARVEGMPADLHDRLYAYISHMPKLLAYAANHVLCAENAPIKTDKKLQKFLRIAASNPALWVDIFELNSDNVLLSLDRYLDAINHIRDEFSQAPADSTPGDDKALALSTLFPRIAASCLITTVMEAEKQAGFSFARFTGTGFADFTAPALNIPDGDIEQISNHHKMVGKLLDAYIDTLGHYRALIAANKFSELEKTLRK